MWSGTIMSTSICQNKFRRGVLIMKKALPAILFFITLATMVLIPVLKGYVERPIVIGPSDVAKVSNQLGRITVQLSDLHDSSKERIDQLTSHLSTTIATLNQLGSKGPSNQGDEAQIEALKQQAAALQGEVTILRENNEHLRNPDAEPKRGAKLFESFMPIVITGFLGFTAIGLLVWRKDDPHAAKWVYSTFGAILGYWLKGGA
jgi:hypothetical protein